MTYILKPEDLNSVTQVEVAFGTTRLLPERNEIPKDYENRDLFERYVEAIFFGSRRPSGSLHMREEFWGMDGQLIHALRAHLVSFEPKHEHKIEGVAYMLSLATEFKPE